MRKVSMLQNVTMHHLDFGDQTILKISINSLLYSFLSSERAILAYERAPCTASTPAAVYRDALFMLDNHRIH